MKKRSFFIGILLVILIFVGTGCSQSSATKSSAHHSKTEQKQTVTKKKTKSKKDSQSNKNILATLKNKSQKNLKYYALGDSLSAGLFSDSTNSRFTTLFADDLQKGTGKKVVEVNNSSVGKTVTNFGLPNVQALIEQQPDIATIEFGTNDAAYGVDAKNLGDFTTNLDAVVKMVKEQTHAQILLMTTWSPSDGKFVENDAVYDQKIKAIGQKYQVPVVDLATIWKNDPAVTRNDLGYSQTYNRQKDQFHPNQLGHEKIAQLLYQTVQKN